MLNEENLKACQKIIRYRFIHRDLLELALRHRSLSGMKGEDHLNNERLEFLGDAVLNFLVSEFLYHTFPDRQEGYLSKLKATLVSRSLLSSLIRQQNLHQFIQLSEGEQITGGRERLSILANLYEALLGAIYLDGGIIEAHAFVQFTLLDNFDDYVSSQDYHNYKSLLLEYVQGKMKIQPLYQVTEESGPDHNKTFSVRVSINQQEWGSGQGKSKKLAEQNAAKNALIRRKIIQTDHPFDL
ncbi:MAG: ribonuclease III [Candidatus Delongbacteria bacterium]|nr:ribonuclease III [Candidatus Delongbacteria bacterium]